MSGEGNYVPVEPFHIGIAGNEIADQLAEQDTTLHQQQTSVNILTIKIVLRTAQCYNEE